MASHTDRDMSIKEVLFVTAKGAAIFAATVITLAAILAVGLALVWAVGAIRLHFFGVETGLCEILGTRCATTPLELGLSPLLGIVAFLLLSFLIGLGWTRGFD